MAEQGSRGVVTMVCITCGSELFFENAPVPPSLKCAKCSGSVFREFATPTEPDEATESLLEETNRMISYGDASPNTTRDELRELDQQ